MLFHSQTVHSHLILTLFGSVFPFFFDNSDVRIFLYQKLDNRVERLFMLAVLSTYYKSNPLVNGLTNSPTVVDCF